MFEISIISKQTRRFNWIEEKLKFMAYSLKKAINSKIEVQKIEVQKKV